MGEDGGTRAATIVKEGIIIKMAIMLANISLLIVMFPS